MGCGCGFVMRRWPCAPASGRLLCEGFMSPPCNSAFVKAKDAARLIGISVSTFHNLRATGRLGPVPSRLGRSVLYGCSDLLAWADSGFPPREKWAAMRKATK